MPATSQQHCVSIIMPTYNRGSLVAETIRSIQNQTYRNWELLIMDDGSDDGTAKLVEAIADERILFHKGNRTGMVGRLKNKAINLSRGSLIAFIDSDDLWHTTKLEKQVTALDEYPEAGFCLVNGYNFGDNDQPVNFFYKQREGARYGNVFTGCFQSEVAGYTQALLVRKECIATAGYFKEDKNFSDFDFIISLAWHSKAVILYEPLIFRRIHTSNYSASTWEKNMYEGIELIEEYKNRIPAQIAKKSLFRLHIDFGEKYLGDKQHWHAIKQFNKAWQYRPLTIVPAKKMAKTLLSLLKIV